MQMKKFTALLLTAFMLTGIGKAANIEPRPDGVGIDISDIYKQPESQFKTLPDGRTSIARLEIQQPSSNPLVKCNPSRVTAGGSDIYAWSVYSISPSVEPSGYYSVGADAISMLWADTFSPTFHLNFANATLIDGLLYGNYVFSTSGLTAIEQGWNIYDAATGELISTEVWDPNNDPYYCRSAYNTDDGCLYGMGVCPPHTEGHVSRIFMKAPIENPKDIEVICGVSPSDVLSAMCYCEEDKCFYCVNNSGEVVKWDTEGNITNLFPLGLEEIGFNPYLQFGIVYSPIEKRLYMSPSTYSSSYIVSCDPHSENGDVRIEYELVYGNQLVWMVTEDEGNSDPLRPAKPTLKEINFPNGDRSGYAVFTMPDTYASGDKLTAKMAAIFTLDNEDYEEVSTEAGEDVKVDFKSLDDGFHRFGCYVDCEGHLSQKTQTTQYIGFDTPSAPKNVKLTKEAVTWDAVTTSEHNGYVDYDSIEYTVVINGKTYGSTVDTTLNVSLPEDDIYQNYQAEVFAISNGVESEAGTSNLVACGEPFSLPLEILPTPEQAQLCRVRDIDGNGSANWGSLTGAQKFVCDNYSSQPSDDWLFLPPFKVEEGDKYISVAFEIAVMMEGLNDSKISVYVGNEGTPEAMTQCVVEEFTPETINPSYATINGLFKAEAQTYYMGFHCINEPNGSGIYLRNINIVDNNITDKSPVAPEEITTQAFPMGELKASVTFDMPTKCIDGSDLATDTELVATVTSSEQTVTISGKPGEQVSADVTTLQSSLGDLNVIEVYVSDGDLNSPAKSVEVYTGVSTPAAPQGLRSEVSADMLTVSVEWDPVTQPSVENGYIDPAGITYSIRQGLNLPFGLVWIALEDGLTECKYDYIMEEGATMEPKIIGVLAQNEAGNNGYISLVTVIAGTPYKLPVADNFMGGEFDTTPWLIYAPEEDYTATWSLVLLSNLMEIPGVPETQHGIVGMAEEGMKGCMCPPRFSTKDCEGASVTISAYTGPECPKVTLYGRIYGTEELYEIGSFSSNGKEEITDFTFNLPKELLGQYWVEVHIDVEFDHEESVFIMTGISASADTSTVADINSTSGIYGGEGVIVVEGFEGQEVSIFSANGFVAAQGVARSNRVTHMLPAGVYVVKAADRTEKVIVR